MTIGISLKGETPDIPNLRLQYYFRYLPIRTAVALFISSR